MSTKRAGILVLLLALTFIVSLPVGLTAGTYNGGSGTSGDPYKIATTADLIELSNTSADWDAYFIQTANIAFAADETQVDWDGDGTADWDTEDQKGFSPIGVSLNNFHGHYNGGNYTITNLYINRPDTTGEVGLFGRIGDATIENVGLEAVYINGGANAFPGVGALVGISFGTVKNCYSTGEVETTDGTSVGGLVGENNGTVTESYSDVSLHAHKENFDIDSFGGLVGWNSGTVTGSHSTGKITATNDGDPDNLISGIGGLVGNQGGNDALVKNSYSTGTVDVTNCTGVGGLAGANSGTIEDSHSTGTVQGSDSGDVGGLAGVSSGSVSNSYSTGSVDISNPVNGYENFGGLVGQNGSSTPGTATLSSSYSTGSVTISNSTGANVGGLVGKNYRATLNNSYSTADVTINNGNTDDSVGGLVGYNYWESTVNKSYSIGTVTSDAAGNVGGLVGDNYDDNCTVSNSFWNAETSGQTSSDGGTGKTTAEMNEGCTFISAGWFFASSGTTTDGTWTIDETGTDNNGYPALAWQEMNNSYGPCAPVVQTKDPSNITSTSATLNGEIITDAGSEITTRGFCWSTSPEPTTADNNTTDVTGTDEFSADVAGLTSETTYYVRAYAENGIGLSYGDELSFSTAPGYSGGSGTEADPYKIATTSDLVALSNFSGHWDKHFIQTADIEFNPDESQVDWNGDGPAGPPAGFLPIGNSTTSFSGIYNGQKYKIENLYIDRSTDNNVGLFGYTSTGATIKNVGVVGAEVTGNNFVGGLVGYNTGGTVSNSYSTASVEGSQYVGGLVGYNYANGTVNKSYSTGEVSGSSYIGGLVGWNHFFETTVSNSYSTASAGGDQFVGGLLGLNDGKGPYQGAVENCYSTGEVSGSDPPFGGLVGANSGTVNNSFWNTETSDQVNPDGGEGKTTGQMTWEYGSDTYDGWDFSNTWLGGDHKLVEDHQGNTGYPALRWQGFPTANFTYSPSSLTTIDRVTFDASTSSDPDGTIESYEWDWDDDGNYEDSLSSQTIKHSFSTAGDYQVTLKVVDNDGASGTASKTVSVKTSEELKVKWGPNPINPEKDQAHLYYQLPSDVSSGTFNVYSATGRQVYSTSLSSGSSPHEWSLVNDKGEPLADGIYLYIVKAGDQRSEVGKLMVERK